MIFGVDVSSFVPKVDWALLARNGIKFASIRCSVGNWLDPMHGEHTQNARSEGILTQSYGFDDHKIAVADAVAAFLDRAFIDQLSPAGDFEVLAPDKTVPLDAGSRADTWLQLLKEWTGDPNPIGYASRSYWEAMCKQVPTLGGPNGWPWWCADYVGQPYPVVVPGLPYVALQYAGDVPMPGVSGLVDRDVVFEASLEALCAPGFAVP